MVDGSEDEEEKPAKIVVKLKRKPQSSQNLLASSDSSFQKVVLSDKKAH